MLSHVSRKASTDDAQSVINSSKKNDLRRSHMPSNVWNVNCASQSKFHLSESDIVRILNVSLIVVLSDQLSKLMVRGINMPGLGINLRGLQLGSSRPILGDFLRLTYIENPGMAFGIDLGGKLFFSVFSILASIGILIYLYKARN